MYTTCTEHVFHNCPEQQQQEQQSNPKDLGSKFPRSKNNFCTHHVLNLYFSCNSMNNLSSYCGLTDSRMRASDTDLPVQNICKYLSLDIFHDFA